MTKAKHSPYNDAEDSFEKEVQKYVRRIMKHQQFAMIDPQALFYWIEVGGVLYFISPDINQAVERATQRIATRYMLMPEVEFFLNTADNDEVIVEKVIFYILETPSYLLN